MADASPRRVSANESDDINLPEFLRLYNGANGTAKLNELNPQAYLHYVLERIAEHPINKIQDLLPWNVVAKLPSLRLAA